MVEWLSAKDATKTGESLFVDVVKPAFGQNGLEASFRRVNSGAEFLALLDQLGRFCESNPAHAPILHVETHASADGLGATPKDSLTWLALKPHLSRINTACGFNLFVVLSACDGAQILQAMSPHEACPVWGILGAKHTTFPSELLKGFGLFYETLLSSRDINQSVAKLQTCFSADHTFAFMPAQFFFASVFADYLSQNDANVVHRQRETDILAELKRRKPFLSKAEMSLMRKRVRAEVRDHTKYFEMARKRFFMEDRFPNNARRFEVSLADCRAVLRAKRQVRRKRAV